MACFFSIPFSNNPYITPWGTIGQDGELVDQLHPGNYRHQGEKQYFGDGSRNQGAKQYFGDGSRNQGAKQYFGDGSRNQGAKQYFGDGSRKQSAKQCSEDSYPYYVQPGDTLYYIAMRLEVGLSDIIEANPRIDTNSLNIGQIICIPACPQAYSIKYIQPGDTLEDIAREYETSVGSILESNPGIDPYYLRIGQRLCINRHDRLVIH